MTPHLADALRDLSLPDGSGQAWGAAESGIARDLRSVLRDEHGMSRTHAHAKGYRPARGRVGPRRVRRG
jgi:NADPH-dependent ferric siderophore reductase